MNDDANKLAMNDEANEHTNKDNVNALTAYILNQCSKNPRLIVAIAGPPGSGKSTLADQLNHGLTHAGRRCCVVPMDGFHLDNSVLSANNLLPRKGSPSSFDANGFVHAMKRIHANESAVYMPVFDRTRDIAIAGVQCVTDQEEVILVEGNYLLLNDEPWNALAELFDVQLFINPGMDVIERRILDRWRGAGLDADTIQRRTYDNDLPNAERVVTGSNTSKAIEFDPTRDFSHILR